MREQGGGEGPAGWEILVLKEAAEALVRNPPPPPLWAADSQLGVMGVEIESHLEEGGPTCSTGWIFVF